MAKKAGLGKRSRAAQAAPTIVEDLDLDVSDYIHTDHVNDDDVVHNRRPHPSHEKKAHVHRVHGKDASSRYDDELNDEEVESRLLSVLPSDAHVRVDDDEENATGCEYGGYREEEEMAVATERAMRQSNVEEDFDVAGLSVAAAAQAATEAAATRRSARAAALLTQTTPMVEAVERDFAALSTTERVTILRQESPELLTMLDDLKKYLAEVKQVVKPLHDLFYERRVAESDRHLVSFLETKVQLMLSYCMHVTFYLLLKVNGQKVSNHPVIDRLVEIRVYLEKMWPLEEKLQYSLHRLLSGKTSAAAGPQLGELRPVQEHASGMYTRTAAANRGGRDEEAKQRRDEMRRRREAEELEREEQSAMTRVRTKKATELNAVDLQTTIAPLSYQEDEDQFFSKLTAHRRRMQQDSQNEADDDDDDEDDDDGMHDMTLMERLRRRHAATTAVLEQQQRRHKAGNNASANDSNDEEGGDSDDGEADLLSGADDEDEITSRPRSEPRGRRSGAAEDEDGAGAYDAVWEEERERVHEERRMDEDRAQQRKEKQSSSVVELEKRKAGKRIESHRGLTKARPRDRKNPRVAQRRKYERGMRVHKAQSRQHQPEPEGGFAGVQSLKPTIVRSKKFK